MRMQFGELNITPRVVSRLHDLDFTVPELEDAIAEHKSDCNGEPSAKLPDSSPMKAAVNRLMEQLHL